MKREAHRDDADRLLSAAPQPERADPLDVLVCGNLLVERHDRGDRLNYVLFGLLDADATETVEAQLLKGSEDTILLDLTHLNVAEPVALCRLVERQREEHQAGRQLLLRIAPEQVAQLSRL